MFIIVTIKLTAPKIDDIPDKCNEKIAKSIELPECDWIDAKGGYHFYIYNFQ